MITKYIASVISVFCYQPTHYDDPHACVEFMEQCVEVECQEFPDDNMDSILENCIESYQDYEFFFSEDKEAE